MSQQQDTTQTPRSTWQVIEDYLRNGDEIYKDRPSIPRDEGSIISYTDPYKAAFADALYIWGNGNPKKHLAAHNTTPEELVNALEQNKNLIQNSIIAYPSSEWRTQTGKVYQSIITWIENVTGKEEIEPLIEQQMRTVGSLIKAIKTIAGTGSPGVIKYIVLTYSDDSTQIFYMMEGNNVYRWLLRYKPEIIAGWRTRTQITLF